MTLRDTAAAAAPTPTNGQPHRGGPSPRAGGEFGQQAILREFEALLATLQSLPDTAGDQPLLVGLTSLARCTGVSTVAINLARAAANLHHRRVALIDANSCHAALHECLFTPVAPGLNDYLAGETELTHCLHETSFERLMLMPIGTSSQRSQRVSVVDLVEAVEDLFACVVVDLPTIGAIDGRVALARNLDAVVLVLPKDRTEVLNTRAGIKQLKRLGIRVRGIVTNAVRNAERSQSDSYAEHDWKISTRGDT